MNFTLSEKREISKKLTEKLNSSGFSASKFARTINLVPADITNITNFKWEEQPELIGKPKWIKIARAVEYDRRKKHTWRVAETKVFKYLYKQLSTAQAESISVMFCDDAGIGKTFTAKEYVKRNQSAFLIDCCASQGKANFVRAISQAVGVGRLGRINDLIDQSIFALSQMEDPLLILDEAGDLENSALMVLKQLYNSLEGICGFYLIGANGMKKKIERGIMNEKLGFIELYSRYGRKFSRVTPNLPIDQTRFYSTMADEIADANGLSYEETLDMREKMKEGGTLHDMRKAERAIKIIKKKRKNGTPKASK